MDKFNIKKIGSVCSGIEAASVSWESLDWKFSWFSEIAQFPSELLSVKYPSVENLGDMENIPSLITNKQVEAPDLICGGTPCQAFSYAGLKNGLNDNRGNLTLKFIDIIDENDRVRKEKGESGTIVLWENVEGVLNDKTNAFGTFISYLAGLDSPIDNTKFFSSGILHGKKRNVAWRVLDAKFFGLPQQRRRIYLLAGPTNFYPENVLFEKTLDFKFDFKYPEMELNFDIEGNEIKVYREYTDCLYSSYGTKWNGNAAAYNGSLYVSQNNRVRRLTPLETERLMGFPDNYTNIKGSKRTNRYQAIGNSWAVPVIKWIGERLISSCNDEKSIIDFDSPFLISNTGFENFLSIKEDVLPIAFGEYINCSSSKNKPEFGNMKNIIECNPDEKLYLSPTACHGILRRKNERNLKMNNNLEIDLVRISNSIDISEIERISRVQKRGKYSK